MKINALFGLLAFAAVGAQAEVLTPVQALERATECLPAKVGAERRVAARRNAEPILTIGDVNPEVYVFGSVAGGLVVASADSETTPLLGYSEEFAADGELPPSLKWLVGYYGQEIRARREGNVVKRAMRHVSRSDFDPIEPICKTRWNQLAPYNYDCPLDGSNYSVTGCVATAMAQVLKTYEYPAKCSGGTFSYTWKNGNKILSKNFNNVTLDWANMLDTYPSRADKSEVTSQAVAKLMSALGYASRMNYSASSSGTSDLYCAEGLIRNFDYDYTLQYLHRDWFDLDAWQQKIYNELAAGHPVYYSGVNTSEKIGHAFVVDGYNANGYFHVNWGWGGYLDGYFLLTALDPEGEQGVGGSSGGYSEQSGAIFNMSPGKTMTAEEAPLTIYSLEPLQVPSATKLGASISDNILVYNYAPFTVPQVGLTLRFTNSNGDDYFASFVGTGELEMGYGIGGTASYSIPSNLPDGDYTVTRIAYNPVTDKVYDLFYDRGVNWRISATVSGKNITFSEYQEPLPNTLFFSEVVFPSVIYFGEEFSIQSYFCNPTATDYTGRLHIDFYRQGSSEIAYGLQTIEFTLPTMTYMEFSPTTTIDSGELAPGEYTIALSCDDESAEVATAPVSIRMRRGVLQSSNFECTSQHINDVCFSIDLTSLDHDYSGTVTLLIGETETSTCVWLDSFELNLAAGETTTKSYSGIDLTGKLSVGTECIITGKYVKEDNTEGGFAGDGTIAFTVADVSTGLNTVKSPDAESEVFDLTGRRIKKPSTGIYILRNGTNTQKIKLR